jgi:hypothetical protein
MIGKIIRHLMKITLRSQIAKLPRMFASHYLTMDSDSERIMSRYGIRSPSGLKSAMKKHKARDIDDLARKLEHLEVKRRVRERFDAAMVRLGGGGSRNNPHTQEIRRLVNPRRASEKEIIRERMRKVKGL